MVPLVPIVPVPELGADPERLGVEPVVPFGEEGDDGAEPGPVGRESTPGRSGETAVAAVTGFDWSWDDGADGGAPATLPHTVQ
jgi:hypothetical protein